MVHGPRLRARACLPHFRRATLASIFLRRIVGLALWVNARKSAYSKNQGALNRPLARNWPWNGPGDNIRVNVPIRHEYSPLFRKMCALKSLATFERATPHGPLS